MNEGHGFFLCFEAAADTVISTLVDDGNIGTPTVMAYDSLAAILSRVPFFRGCVVIDVYTMVLAGVYMFSLSEHCFCSFQ